MPSEVRILPYPRKKEGRFLTILCSFYRIHFYAGVTQLVESQPSKLLVAGSSPVSRLTILLPKEEDQSPFTNILSMASAMFSQ